MIILNFFTNIVFYYFPDELHALFHTIDDKLGLSQTSSGKSQPIILIVNLFCYFIFFR